MPSRFPFPVIRPWLAGFLAAFLFAVVADAAPDAIFSDETLLARVGLGLPHVFQMTKVLTRRGLIPSPASDGQPRSIFDLERLLTTI